LPGQAALGAQSSRCDCASGRIWSQNFCDSLYYLPLLIAQVYTYINYLRKKGFVGLDRKLIRTLRVVGYQIGRNSGVQA
jgi:hypothetical protein